jgi:hypothetical protein
MYFVWVQNDTYAGDILTDKIFMQNLIVGDIMTDKTSCKISLLLK